jgi:hypothetical protein
LQEMQVVSTKKNYMHACILIDARTNGQCDRLFFVVLTLRSIPRFLLILIWYIIIICTINTQNVLLQLWIRHGSSSRNVVERWLAEAT